MGKRNLILVTGFGPFAGHESCNASCSGEEAVKLLPEELTVDGKCYCIEKIQVPVVYSSVDRIVPEIWDKDPLLVIHCGVHSSADKIHLEKCAYKSCYSSPDWDGQCLPTNSANLCLHGQDCDKLETAFNVHGMAEELNKSHESIFNGSVNVGSYLCGYIYVKSLDFCPSRSLFVHVPKVEVIDPQVVQRGIVGVIQKCLEQMRSS